MNTVKLQNENSGLLLNHSFRRRYELHDLSYRQNYGDPGPPGKETPDKNSNYKVIINPMRARKRRKRNPGLLHYSSGRWHNEAHENLFRSCRGQPELH